jgi:GT2 family glycosyltransferase
VVILTMGQRPTELNVAISSVLSQEFVSLDVIVVGNGWRPELSVSGVRSLYLETNVGIPAGRNAGAAKVTGDFLVFLDDDAQLADPQFIHKAVSLLEVDSGVGLIQPRITDPTGVATPRRWIPRLIKRQPSDSSYVFSVLEACVVIPQHVYVAVGGWGAPYFYAHEGIELAWRVWNAGYRVWYAAELVIHHEVTTPTRHHEYFRLNARNRVWLAKRNLPWILVPFYVATWTVVQILRSLRTRGQGLSAWFSGWREGWRVSPGGRDAMSWKTIARMTRYGRFPIV